MNILEVANLEPNTKVYRVAGTKVDSFIVLGKHPDSSKHYVYLISGYSVSEVVSFYLKNSIENNTFFTTSYEEAKKRMWENLKEEVSSKNRIYMGGKESLDFTKK